MSEADRPLGCVLTGEGAEFGVHAPDAAAAFVCLFDAGGERETARIALTPDGAGAYRGFAPGVVAGQRYGFRVEGPFDPGRGLRFDAAKLLADPYALALDRPYALHPEMFALGADTGASAPKAVALAPPPGAPGFARIPWERTVLYELNLRGFSALREDIPAAARGRFAALAQPCLIEHLQSLGVTSVELMPADAFVDERHLPPLGLANAWGYNPVILGVPDPRLAPAGWADVRAATDALHAAGLEVILDIVLNHNGESDEFGPTLSFRGLDNAGYFRLHPDDRARYINDMGCGNCLALDRPAVVAMAMSALRRWMSFGGIDGFRFDLASAMGRREGGFDPRAPLFLAIAADPVVSRAKLIAEPWDIGPGGYQLGAFPQGWGEWNDRYRDAARRFWRGDGFLRGDLATRIAGSRDAFAQAPSPVKSINFIVAHDGFTLADVVSYEHKHNEANGEDNRDGSSENYSWNHGVEGPSEDPGIRDARARDMRNLLTLLFASRGTPMLAMGAETGHSQHGNNNAYAQDNAISWIDWSRADAGLAAFVGRLAAFRRAHPALACASWMTGQPFDETGLPDVEWRDADGPMTTGEQWNAPFGDILVAVLAAPGESGCDRVIFSVNRSGEARRLRLPEARPGMAWRLGLTTADPEIADAALALCDRMEIGPRTSLLLAESPAGRDGPGARPPDAREVDALAEAAGIAAKWWEVSGRETEVTPETKLALLEALRLPARSKAQCRESLSRLVEETGARRLPASLTLALDAPRSAPLRSPLGEAARDAEFRIATEAGETIVGRARLGEGRRRTLADGREIVEGALDLPELPMGRHRLEIDGVAAALTVAPPECYGASAAWRRRFGLSAQTYALRRARGDQGVGDFTTLGLAGAAAGANRAAFLGVSPLHALFPQDRNRASPYHPSDRRFLDPMLIDVLADDGLPMDDAAGAALAALAGPFAELAALDAVDYPAMWRQKEIALRARFAAFARARLAHPNAEIFADHARFIAEGGEALQRFALFQAIAGERNGEDWRRWPEPLRRGAPEALAATAAQHADEIAFAGFAQWWADRQLAAAAERARAGRLELGFYRDLAVGSAPDGAESWSRAEELAVGVSIGAPPDPFSAQGQIWNLPAPDPIAGAREGWRGLAALYGANMRHAGMLRIDHAMGLTRLFLVPDGAKPAQGAYVAYPADDLIGQIALESQRHRCMVIGEDLGTVPEGFREKLTRANIGGLRVLWFERDGLDFLDPAEYPVKSIACATTHDLPTLAGWWSGADIEEKLSLGLIAAADTDGVRAQRLDEKQAVVARLQASGKLHEAPDLHAPMGDALAAAIHAFVADSGSVFASAQFDDLAGETVGTNLPGTDRERPNWRHRLRPDVEALLTSGRAQAIVAAMATVRV